MSASITGGSFNKNTPTGWITERAELPGFNLIIDYLAWSVCRQMWTDFVGNRSKLGTNLDEFENKILPCAEWLLRGLTVTYICYDSHKIQ